jgi:hypothetical protein
MLPLIRALAPYALPVVSNKEMATRVCEYVLTRLRWSKVIKLLLVDIGLQKLVDDLTDRIIEAFGSEGDQEQVDIQKEIALLEQSARNSYYNETATHEMGRVRETPAVLEGWSDEHISVQGHDPVMKLLRLYGLGIIPPVRRTDDNTVILTLVYEMLKDALRSERQMVHFVRNFGFLPREHMLQCPVFSLLHTVERGATFSSIRQELIETGKSLHAELEEAFQLVTGEYNGRTGTGSIYELFK